MYKFCFDVRPGDLVGVRMQVRFPMQAPLYRGSAVSPTPGWEDLIFAISSVVSMTSSTLPKLYSQYSDELGI